jgi:ABC-type multidrug transport system ATPase subunit
MLEQTFKYTAKKGDFMSIALTFGFLVVIEGGIIGLLVALLVPDDWWKPLIFLAMAGLYVLVFGFLFGALSGKHTLTNQEIRLRYGRTFRGIIHRDNLVSATPAREKIEMPLPFGVAHDADKKEIRAAFSDQGQIWLKLKQPQEFRKGLKKLPADHVLINVDDAPAFLASLNLAEVAFVPPQKTLTIEQPIISYVNRTPAPIRTGEPAIRTEVLTRRYPGGFCAVSDLNLRVYPGEIYGFLGSNGAGKTTTIKMLVGLLEPSAGRAYLAGHNVWTEADAAKASLGYVADKAILYDRLSGREFLNFLAQMRGIPSQEANARIDELLTLLDLNEAAGRPCGGYSFGMKRKLSLAGALLHRPSVLILDEPLNGLDPRSARRLKDLLLDLAASGTTILLSTHDLATAEEVCHRVGILHRGKLLAEGSAADLRAMSAASDLEEVFLNLTEEAVSPQLSTVS